MPGKYHLSWWLIKKNIIMWPQQIKHINVGLHDDSNIININHNNNDNYANIISNSNKIITIIKIIVQLQIII